MSQFNSKIFTTHIVINNHLHKNINRYSPSSSHTITIIHQIQIIINLYVYGLSPKTYMNLVPHLLIVLPELYYWTFLNIVARDMLLDFSQHGCQRYVTGLFSHICKTYALVSIWTQGIKFDKYYTYTHSHIFHIWMQNSP